MTKTPESVHGYGQSDRSPVSRVRPLPLAGLPCLGRPSDIWFKPALSVIVAAAPPNRRWSLGRLDPAAHTMAGLLCALYAYHRPYAARARALGRVVLGLLGGLAVAPERLAYETAVLSGLDDGRRELAALLGELLVQLSSSWGGRPGAPRR